MKKLPLIAGLLLCAAGFAAAGAAGPDDTDRGSGRDHHGEALALGDSVVFGYITSAFPQYIKPDNFVGSPEYLADLLDLEVTNASCPGETTSHLLSLTGADYKCGSYRGPFPLHVRYSSSQLDFAKGFLTRQRQVRLVTIGVGANDIFALQNRCAINEPNNPACVPYGLPPVLNQVAQNVAWLISQLRSTGYGGPIVVVNYYSPDYADAQLMQLTGALNQALAGAAQSQGAVVADVFTAFLKAASTPAAGGKICSTGLLNVNPAQPALCDFHPSLSGQKLIAQTIAASLRGRNW